MTSPDPAGRPRSAIRTLLRGIWAAYQLVLGALLVLAFAAAFAAWHFFHIGDIRALRHKNPATTAFIEAERASHPGIRIRRSDVPLDKIPRQFRQMVLVAEDAKFYNHNGFDWEQIEYALVANRQTGRPVRGASTITQQLAKNLYLSGDKAMSRKLREAVLTFLLEYTLEKDRILELYLNVAQFGPGVFGAAEGARYHFGKPLSVLTQDEMLSLAAVLPSPRRWSPAQPVRAYQNHRNRVARNYGLFRGIASHADTAGGEVEEAYDSLGVLLSRERWGGLRTERPGDSGSASVPEPGETTEDGTDGGTEGNAVPAVDGVPETGAGEGDLPE